MNKNKIRIFSSKKNKNKRNKDKQLISVITICYYDEKYIEKTIKSVLGQKYTNIEYIMVVRPSEDKTFEIIKKYKNKIDKIIICEKKGIYLAMNVGTSFAKGEYINFMNSGDYFTNKNIVNYIFKNKHKSDVIYGDCVTYYDDYFRKIKSNPIESIVKELPFTHQSAFAKTKLQKKYKFNTNHGQSADYDFFLKLYKKKKKFLYYEKYISARLPYGNQDERILTLYDNYIISIKHLGKSSFIRKLIFLKVMLYYGSYVLLKTILPKKIISLIIRLKN